MLHPKFRATEQPPPPRFNPGRTRSQRAATRDAIAAGNYDALAPFEATGDRQSRSRAS